MKKVEIVLFSMQYNTKLQEPWPKYQWNFSYWTTMHRNKFPKLPQMSNIYYFEILNTIQICIRL